MASHHDPATENRQRRPRRSSRHGRFSSLTWRILAINLLALVIVVAGMLYLDTYRAGLIEAKIDALGTQGTLIAAALAESVVTGQADGRLQIDQAVAGQLLARLIAPINSRARLYDQAGNLLADSRRWPGAWASVQAASLPPPAGAFEESAGAVYDWIVSKLPAGRKLDPYIESSNSNGSDYAEVGVALGGVLSSALRAGGESGADGIILNLAIPVQRFKQVQGVLLLTPPPADIEDSVRAVRYGILQLFAVALAITISLSLYLAGTIARPLYRLAEAADAVRHGHEQGVTIPDFSHRGDEIGDLSRALREMTQALSERMNAIESFAADVAHEIKNPLSSMRSAVEAAARIDDPAAQRRLLAVVEDDVRRLDRLISDISDASRLDAELARAESKPVDLGALLATRADAHPSVVFTSRDVDALTAPGIERRLVQVFENLIANGRSFSPDGGVISITARRCEDWVEVVFEDDGPGIPVASIDAIFERFYKDRPEGETFGTHSGLGLSISKQIIEAHGGVIFAENRGDDPANPAGARFILRLPL